MDIGQVLISFFIAIILTAVFAGIFRAAGPWKGYWPYFLVIFFVALAAARWIIPIGPAIWGYYWAPILITALIVALLIWTITPTKYQKRKNANFYDPDPAEPPKSIHRKDERVKSVVIGVNFWFLILLLITTIIIGALV